MLLGLNPIRLSVFLNFYFSNKQISVPFKIFLRTENGNKKVVDRRVKMESTRFKKKILSTSHFVRDKINSSKQIKI